MVIKLEKVEYFHDYPLPPPDSERRLLLEQKYVQTKELANIQFQAVLPQIEQKFGKMPADDVTRFSWWLSSIIPTNYDTKTKLLSIQSVEVRIDELITLLVNMRNMTAANTNPSSNPNPNQQNSHVPSHPQNQH